MLKQISSTGYLRKRVPQELVVLNGGQTVSDIPVSGGETVVVEAQASAVAITAASRARMQGFEGEACGECGNYTLVRNGTCMKCNTCGATSGCS